MILNVTSVIQCALITLTQTTARISWLFWRQEDQTVPRSSPRCHRKIPRIASFDENSDQRAKMFGSCSYRSRFRNLKKVGGKIQRTVCRVRVRHPNSTHRTLIFPPAVFTFRESDRYEQDSNILALCPQFSCKLAMRGIFL